jgi:organic radical activating enzyme
MMANLMLTEDCNLRCPYCFAKERVGVRKKEASLSNVKKYIQFLKESGIDECSFIGGEPTLHSHFDQVVELCLRSNMGIGLFSNGTWPTRVSGILEKIPRIKLGVLLNVNPPSFYNSHIWNTLNDNLLFLKDFYEGNDGLRLSLNISKNDFEYEYILDLAHKYNVRVVRFATCVPLVGTSNEYVHFEEQKSLGNRIMSFVRSAKQASIFVIADCGVTPCIFTSEQIGELIENNYSAQEGTVDFFRKICSTVVDIGTDLMVWRCFSTSSIHKVHLSYFNNIQEIDQYFKKVYKNYLHVFPARDCYSCNWAITKQCRGGCLAHSIQ